MNRNVWLSSSITFTLLLLVITGIGIYFYYQNKMPEVTAFELYSEENFTGTMWTLDTTKESYNNLNLNIKSFKIPPGLLVKMYFAPNFEGDPVKFGGTDADIYYFRRFDFPIKSIKISKYQRTV